MINLSLAGLLCSCGFVVQAAGRTPVRVDLRGAQTPIQNQGNRRTCTKFATVAALEAAYRRAGYKDLKLSEEFAAYLEKMLWLDPQTGGGADTMENQAGGWGGGNGLEVLRSWTRGLAIPEARAMPYRPGGYVMPPQENWKSQYVVSAFNLNPRNLPVSALTAARYYSVKSYRQIKNPRNPAVIEKVLARGYEIVCTFNFAGRRPPSGMWTTTGPASPKNDHHAMLVVGYNRKKGHKPYFIVKNSWGPTATPSARGFTYISYGYLKRYAEEAAFITAVNRPRPWPALRVLGRWLLSFDGWKGILDIYHVPGAMQWHFEDIKQSRLKDLRIGTFYEQGDPRRAHRVNGRIQGNRIEFYIDWKTPNLRPDRLRGRKFIFYLGPGDASFMAGLYRDPDGRAWGGYARKLTSAGAFTYRSGSFHPEAWPELGFLRTVGDGRNLSGPGSFVGTWQVCSGSRTGTLALRRADNGSGPREGRTGKNALAGEFSWDRGRKVPVTVRLDGRDAARVEIAGRVGAMRLRIVGKRLSWEKGVVAGTFTTSGKGKGVSGVCLVRKAAALPAGLPSASFLTKKRKP
jgi:hypothetical protein